MLFCVLNVVNILQTKCFLLVFKLFSYSHMLANFYNHFIACIRVLETCWWQTAFDLLLWISKRTDLNNVQVNFMYALCPEIERVRSATFLADPIILFWGGGSWEVCLRKMFKSQYYITTNSWIFFKEKLQVLNGYGMMS